MEGPDNNNQNGNGQADNKGALDQAIDNATKNNPPDNNGQGGDGGGNPPPDNQNGDDGAQDGASDLFKGIDLNGAEGDKGGDKGNQPPAGKDGQPPAMSDEEYIKAAGIEGDAPVAVGKAESGEDITFSPAEAKAIAPALNKLGIPADKAKGVMGLYAHLDTARRTAWEKEDAEALENMAKEVRKEFGDDLDKTLNEMVRGCRHVFPEALWRQIQTVKPLMYNKDFIGAMAKVWRDYSQDNGTGGAPAAKTPKSIYDDFTAARWFEGSNQNRNAN